MPSESCPGSIRFAKITMSIKFKKLTDYLAKLQGVGPRQSLRIGFGLLNWPPEELHNFAQSITDLAAGVRLCEQCFNLSENTKCHICSSPQRDQHKICVVEKVLDLQAIERTGLFKGLYHVLGGAINPVDGVLPNNLKLAELKARLGRANGEAKQVEIILATNPTTYGETTALYIEEMLKPLGITTTRLARGLASGSYLEYIDATTLQNALKNRR